MNLEVEVGNGYRQHVQADDRAKDEGDMRTTENHDGAKGRGAFVLMQVYVRIPFLGISLVTLRLRCFF